MSRLLRRPPIHFLLLGAALYLGEQWIAGTPTGGEAPPPQVVRVSAERREQLADEWRLTRGRSPTADEAEWLAESWAEEEILYREALRLGLDREHEGVCHRLALNLRFLEPAPAAGKDRSELCRRARELGLDRDDPVIRRQLAASMRLLLARPELGGEEPLARAEVRAYVERHRKRFSEPARVRLSHVFLAPSARRADPVEDARRLRARLAAEAVDPRRAVAMADPFLAGHHLPASTPRMLARQFGPEFASAVMGLSEGRWSGPVESSFGAHLVWIHERRPARLRPLEEVAERAARELAAELSEARLESNLEQLRQRWEIRIARGPNAAGSG